MAMKVFASPGRLVLGAGALKELPAYVKPYGSQVVVIALKDDVQRVDFAMEALKEAEIGIYCADFCGECTLAEIERMVALVQSMEDVVVIGLGGGKALDTAKSTAVFTGKPLIIVPTIASSDAPCSALSVVYTADHVYETCHYHHRNPNVVMVDTAVIAQAPARFLVAGMGDAYATAFEARACYATQAINYVGGVTTQGALALAEKALEILHAHGAQALADCKVNKVTPALEMVIEANLLMSGIGFESCGLAGAHSVSSALTKLPATKTAMHGELVALGLLSQHRLQGGVEEVMEKTLAFYDSIGLPKTLADLQIPALSPEEIDIVAQVAMAPDSDLHHLPQAITMEQMKAVLALL